MIQLNRRDWRFVMKRQKKQYRPIAGQRWYEKILDWITREENYWWGLIGICGSTGIMVLGVFISANVLELSDIADLIFAVWFKFIPIVAVIAVINPLSAGWDLRAEKRLQNLLESMSRRMDGVLTMNWLHSACR